MWLQFKSTRSKSKIRKATARKAAGLAAYIKTNIDKASDGTASAGTGADIYTTGTARALQESQVEAALSLCWTNGGTPSLGILNAFQKRKAATFSGSSSKMSDGDKRKVTNNVEVYIDPLGTEIRFVPCRQAPTNTVFLVDPEYLEFTTLRDFQTKELAKTGVLVNAITPAAAKTAMFDQMAQSHIDYMLSKIPMRRFLEVQEAAAMVAWLSSEDCSFTTGSVFDITGGRSTY